MLGGRVDVLLSAAGVGQRTSVLDTSAEGHRQIMGANFEGGVALTRALWVTVGSERRTSRWFWHAQLVLSRVLRCSVSRLAGCRRWWRAAPGTSAWSRACRASSASPTARRTPRRRRRCSATTTRFAPRSAPPTCTSPRSRRATSRRSTPRRVRAHPKRSDARARAPLSLSPSLSPLPLLLSPSSSSTVPSVLAPSSEPPRAGRLG